MSNITHVMKSFINETALELDLDLNRHFLKITYFEKGMNHKEMSNFHQYNE